MKAMMVNPNSSSIITSKMRDEMYMKHLREVEKISNREAEQVAKDLQSYRSITHMHLRNKMHARDWNVSEEDKLIE